MKTAPRILLMRHNIMKHHYFVELASDLAAELGPCLLYTGGPSEYSVGGLQVKAGPPDRRGAARPIRLLSWMQYSVLAAWLAVTTPGRPLLFIVAQPPWLPLIGLLKKWLVGQPYLAWVDDIYPDVLVRHGYLRSTGLVVGIWSWLNRIMLNNAERVVTIGEEMAQTLAQYVNADGGAGPSIIVVPTWVDTEEIKPLPKRQNWFASQQRQVGKLTVLYSGNLGLSHDLDTVIAAARELGDHPDVHFLIIGHGARWQGLQETVASLETRNVTLLPFQPDQVLPYSLATADVAVVSLDKGLEGISMPSKTYYAMAAGSAIAAITVTPSDLQGVVERHRCGFVVAPGDVRGFVAGIKRFIEEPHHLDLCRHNARLAAERRFSRHVNVKRVLAQIRPLLPSVGKVVLGS